MKKFKLCCIILAILFCGLSINTEAKAFNFGSTGSSYFYYGSNGTYPYISRAYVYDTSDLITRTFYPTNYDNTPLPRWTFDSISAGVVNRVELANITTIPAGSIFSFTLRISNNTNGKFFRYTGLSASNFVVLSENCHDNVREYWDNKNFDVNDDLICRYVAYTSNAIGPAVNNNLTIDGSLFNIQFPGVYELSIGKLSFVQITSESGGSSTDYTSLLNQIISQLQANNQAVTLGNIESILENIENNQPSAQDIADAIAEAELTEMEDATEDAETAAESAGEQAESATQSLIGTAQSIIGAITDTPATNCQINMNLGNINLGTMDFCTMWPQQIRDVVNNVTTIVLVIAVLLLSYNLVEIYVAYITDYQEKT